MQSIKINGTTGISNLLVGERLGNLGRYIQDRKAVIITDINIWHHYRKDFPDLDVIQIGTGETAKNLDSVRYIYEKLVDLEMDRSCLVVGIGGGIVCDITGFAASTFMRGLPFGYVASTLLAQVDASVGGKTGVNLEGYKNLVGVFSQPEFVICDPELLKTLPPEELACGLAEIVKHAAIADIDLLTELESEADRILALDAPTIQRLVYANVVIKAAVVNRDETERGERRKLNFGHTFGHAIERSCAVRHGEAVSIGMLLAAGLSAQKGYLTQADFERLRNLLKKMHLPTKMPLKPQEILESLGKDKKREGQSIHFVLLKSLGRAVVEPLAMVDLEAAAAGLFDMLR